MLEGLSVRNTAKTIGISPTTAYTWRKKVLALLEQHAHMLLPSLNQIVEKTTRQVKPSRKGLPSTKTISVNSQTLQFEKDRLNNAFVRIFLSSHESNRPHFPKNSKQLVQGTASPADRILYHNDNVMQLEKDFSAMYRKMRGVAQPYLYRYALWQCFLHRLEPMKTKHKLINLLKFCL